MSNDIRKFNRFELKYILSLEEAERLKKDLKYYIVPDKYGNAGAYTLSSLYYDSPDYKFYWEKIEGIKFRRKVRIRRYVTGEAFDENSKVYVEIKQRIDRVTQKRRVPMSYKEATNLIENYEYPKNFDEKDKVVLDEIIEMSKVNNLRPSAITTYDRQAFFWTDNDAWLRVTFDTFVSYKKNDLDLTHSQAEWFMLPPKFCILEVKANERIPLWITELVSSHNIKLIRVSKYCQALESAKVFPKSLYNTDFVITSSNFRPNLTPNPSQIPGSFFQNAREWRRGEGEQEEKDESEIWVGKIEEEELELVV